MQLWKSFPQGKQFSLLKMADPAPLPIDHVSQVFSLAFHPEEDIVASGLITGEVYGYRYNGGEEAVKVFESTHHKESCRALEFSVDGLSLYTGSRDQSLQVIDTTTGKVTLRKPAAHADAINTLRVVGEQHTLLASGDDSGCVKIWDTRERKCVMKYHENVDFISDMTFVANKRTLVCTSGDGCLSVFDIRKKKPVAISENQDDELLSIVPVRNSSKVVVGTQTGTLLLFSWGDWGDCTDRFPGHPSSVDSMASLDDSVIMTASGDGILRAIRILPNELVGAVGDHGEMAVESIRVSRDRKWVGSCAHDGVVRFWNVDEALGGGDNVNANGAEVEEEQEGVEDEVVEDSDVDVDGESSDESPSNPSKPSKSITEKPPAASKPNVPSKIGTATKSVRSESSDSDDSDAAESAAQKDTRKKRKKAKRGIGGGGSRSKRAFFSAID